MRLIFIYPSVFLNFQEIHGDYQIQILRLQEHQLQQMIRCVPSSRHFDVNRPYKALPGHPLRTCRWHGLPAAFAANSKVAGTEGGHRRGGAAEGPATRLAEAWVFGECFFFFCVSGDFVFDVFLRLCLNYFRPFMN